MRISSSELARWSEMFYSQVNTIITLYHGAHWLYCDCSKGIIVATVDEMLLVLCPSYTATLQGGGLS